MYPRQSSQEKQLSLQDSTWPTKHLHLTHALAPLAKFAMTNVARADVNAPSSALQPRNQMISTDRTKSCAAVRGAKISHPGNSLTRSVLSVELV
jgi:hypothetical protein